MSALAPSLVADEYVDVRSWFAAALKKITK
jgi:hypothetical protein